MVAIMTPQATAGEGRRKRWRAPVAKPGEVKIVYGRASRWDEPDLCAAWGGAGAAKPDARTVMHALTEKRVARAFPSMEYRDHPSLIEELEARGYDITTLRFTIQKKTPPPPAASPCSFEGE